MESLPRAISFRDRGAALIITLAFVVLLTGLAIAYLSRTTGDRQVAHSSFNQSKVDQLAASAMDLIIGDLQQEIANGSSPTPTPSVPNSTPTPTPFVYPLTAPANIAPMQWPTTPTIPNFIRRSLRYDESGGANAIPSPSPGVASHASTVSSTDASANRRVLTLARWNRHYLIPRAAGASATDTTPDPTVGFVAPDWVIVTRDGPTAFSTWNVALKDSTQSNSSYCVGRYAYAIYDEGGLLDANVAGHPTSSTAAQYGPKGVSAFADLTVLGLSGTGNPNDIDAMVGWRNYFSARQSGNFPNFNLNADNYAAMVLSNTNGFMSVPVPSSTPNNMSNTDQQFTTRQSLIQLLVNSGLSDAATASYALQYLGTFSRELNAPSWAPSLNAADMGGDTGTTYAYRTNADSTTAINRNLLGVRVINSFTRADGTTTAVRPGPCSQDCGEPLINRRFPLTRLIAITPTGPNTTTNSTIIRGVFQPATTAADNKYPELPSGGTIQRDFGLLWNSGNNRWDYVGGSGSAIQTAIERLDQVSAENREPNFFELLKAGILSGSVGMGSGSGNTFVAAQGKYYDTTNNLSSDYQIMQIGANIINQWDSGNVPIFFNFYDSTGNYELAGIKNLPYLNKLVFKPAWTSNTQFAAWLVPSLWNPHQNAPPASQDVRIAMTAGTMTGYITSSGAFQPSTPITGSSTQYMTVDAHSYFGNNSATAPSGPTTANAANGSNITQMANNMGGYWGFNFAFAVNPSITKSNSQTAYPDFGTTGCTFELQVSVGGTWKTYQRWKSCGPNHPLIFQPPTTGNWWNHNDLQDPEFITLDPRTLRFGVWGNAYNQSTDTTDLTAGTQTTLDSPPVEAVTALRPQGTSFHFSASPNNLYSLANNPATAFPNVYYTDLDLVQRQGDFTTLSTTDEMQVALSTDRPLMLCGAYPTPTPSALQNGVFQSVAELGHVFRDQPWKTLTFTSAMPTTSTTKARSADSGLLDVFTLHESSMEAGKTSLNTKQPLVLKAILGGAIKRLAGASSDLISSTQRDNIITALTSLSSSQSMVNKTELITPNLSVSPTRTGLMSDASVTGLGNKEARECVLRAFSDACQTRTWNLMIDLVAQSGRYSPDANSLAGFMVEGEQHYWVHLAIDRFTGQVLDKQIEVVNE